MSGQRFVVLRDPLDKYFMQFARIMFQQSAMQAAVGVAVSVGSDMNLVRPQPLSQSRTAAKPQQLRIVATLAEAKDGQV